MVGGCGLLCLCSFEWIRLALLALRLIDCISYHPVLACFKDICPDRFETGTSAASMMPQIFGPHSEGQILVDRRTCRHLGSLTFLSKCCQARLRQEYLEAEL